MIPCLYQGSCCSILFFLCSVQWSLFSIRVRVVQSFVCCCIWFLVCSVLLIFLFVCCCIWFLVGSVLLIFLFVCCCIWFLVGSVLLIFLFVCCCLWFLVGSVLLIFLFLCCCYPIMCLYVPSSVLWCPLRFPHKTMFGSSLPPIVYVQWRPTHIVLCFCFGFLRLVYSM